MKKLVALVFVLFASVAVAQSTDHGDMPMSTGTITKIDSQWNKLTIDHGPLENLEMEAMTMVFEVADPAMIEGLSEGQEIEFKADRVKGQLTMTEIMTE